MDRLVIRAPRRSRLAESVEHALALGNGLMSVVVEPLEHATEAETTELAPAVAAQPGAAVPQAAETQPAPERCGPAAPGWEGGAQAQPQGEAQPEAAVPQDSEAQPEAAVPQDSEAQPGAAVPQSVPPQELRFSQTRACLNCGRSFDELGPHHFSFNSVLGWCETCEGLGV